jgi:ribonucleoside-diphosphate reductase alpha chain
MIKKTKRQPFEWLTKESRQFLENGYVEDGDKVEERIRFIADNAEEVLGISGFSDKFYDYMSRGWFSLSSPVWSNFGLKRGLPISCFGSYIGDSIAEINFAVSEVAMMSKLGGGTSGYFGHIRSRGTEINNNGTTNGSFPFARSFDTTVDVVSQGSTRRGRFSPYIDIEHPDILEWLEIGLEGNPIQELQHGVCVGDKWLEDMKAGDSDKRKVWAKLIQCRGEIGYPYVFYKDNVNNNTVDVYRDKGMKIYASNLCTEIMLPSSQKESFVCCLSSMNLLHYDEWKDTDAVETMTFFLDAVMEEFITKLEVYRDSEDFTDNLSFSQMERTYNFAKNHRALGIGVVGWHSLLQSNMIPFESFDAMQLNTRVFKSIQEQAYEASKNLADIFGEPELLKGYGRRNTTLTAIAPTKSSSFVLGQVSLGIEPIKSNLYVKDLAKIKTTFKNKFLTNLLEEKGMNTKDVWRDIRDKDGSVQHLDFLSDHEKDVFKTWFEISQLTLVQQASSRQKYICQAQSLNLAVHPSTPTKEVNKLMMTAHELGVKSLYYQENMSAAQQFKRELNDCASCEG